MNIVCQKERQRDIETQPDTPFPQRPQKIWEPLELCVSAMQSWYVATAASYIHPGLEWGLPVEKIA